MKNETMKKEKVKKGRTEERKKERKRERETEVDKKRARNVGK